MRGCLTINETHKIHKCDSTWHDLRHQDDSNNTLIDHHTKYFNSLDMHTAGNGRTIISAVGSLLCGRFLIYWLDLLCGRFVIYIDWKVRCIFPIGIFSFVRGNIVQATRQFCVWAKTLVYFTFTTTHHLNDQFISLILLWPSPQLQPLCKDVIWAANIILINPHFLHP